ncbi:uncharacterized protein LOC121904981 isoform X1 [Thunnus maccoyii]|uniref:uncharacterized protein LOC121904981 isoform X1 n=1 Tax=Thunnus maccoyii TaxID=8240 RepID=UPI001C4B984B|nr:uncharacterized protein LOC121904981 isoform X1 [Thunnus maccoyii]
MPFVEEAELDNLGDASLISLGEVSEVVKKLLSSKALGVDGIHPKMLKALDIVGLSWLARLFSVTWRSGTVAVDWQTGVVVLIFKKGNQGDHTTQPAGKSLYQGAGEEAPADCQTSDSGGKMRILSWPWTVDQLFTLSRTLEWSWEFAHPVYMCFVDLAYDRTPWCTLWAIWSLYNHSESCVRILSSESNSFSVGVGLRQSCPLSSIPFVIFMDKISRRGRGVSGLRTSGFASLLSADDVVLLASTHCHLQQALGWFAAECEAVGTRVSTPKSEAMVLSLKKVDCSLWVGSELLLQVKEFKYLWVLFMREGKIEHEDDRQISAASALMQALYFAIVVKKELTQRAKLLIYLLVYVPTLTYAHEF